MDLSAFFLAWLAYGIALGLYFAERRGHTKSLQGWRAALRGWDATIKTLRIVEEQLEREGEWWKGGQE